MQYTAAVLLPVIRMSRSLTEAPSVAHMFAPDPPARLSESVECLSVTELALANIAPPLPPPWFLTSMELVIDTSDPEA